MSIEELFNSCIDGIIRISYSQIILDANEAFANLTGYSIQELLGKSLIDLTPKEYHKKDLEIIHDLSSNGFAEEYQKELIRKNGISLSVSMRLWGVFKNNEISSYYWGIVKEVTTQISEKRKEKVEIQSNYSEGFKNILDNLPIGIALIDKNKVFKLLNTGYLNILQIVKEENILEKSFVSLFPRENIISELFWKETSPDESYFDIAISQNRPISFTKDYHKKHLRVNYISLSEKEKNVLMVLIDATEEHELEKKFRQSQKMDSIGVLTGGIAHDFNNILTGILGYAELLKLSLPKEVDAHEEIQGIISASNRATDLIRQLLTFSRQTETKAVVINITTVLKEIIRLLRGSFPSNIEIFTEYPIDTWNTMADPAKMHQVIMNLCINAKQAMPEGGTLRILILNIEIDEEFSKRNFESTPGKYVCLIVEDTGTGMTEEVKNRVFEPFFTTKVNSGGTGLGMAIVYGIIKSMRGFVELESEVNVGTTFKIYLPAVFKEVSEDGVYEDNLKGGHETILFVDDEVSIVEISTSILKNFGYKTMKAYNGQEALEIYKQNKDNIDLIITDLTMPKLSGTGLTKEVLKINPKQRIILCSGYASDHIISDLKEIGIKEFIQKPLIASIFLSSVRNVLDTIG